MNKFVDKPYLDLCSKIDFNPIFIMGEHRSGTTLLYQTLVATECFNCVRAYHIIKYNEILSNYINQTENQVRQELEELFKSLGISDRMIDNVVATPDSPTEYGFILRNAGYQSHLNPENLSLFIELCRKIQFISNPNRPLLLKNPWCFSHFKYVKDTFPKAKFIFIHRHPIHVINSKLKAIRLLFSTKNSYTTLIFQEYSKILNNPLKNLLYRFLYSNYFDIGLRRFTKSSVESTTYFLENINSLLKTDYISLGYEELCQFPESTIFKILNFLGLEAKAVLEYDKLIEKRPIQLLPEVSRKYSEICQKLEPYLNYYGYDS
ncbi:MAG: sulfotransferase [Okeania sp. SIO3I5]|nr:sulfotransferase [Okeania sp. SIO3I5]